MGAVSPLSLLKSSRNFCGRHWVENEQCGWIKCVNISAGVSQIQGSSAAAGNSDLVSDGCARPVPVDKYKEHTERVSDLSWVILPSLTEVTAPILQITLNAPLVSHG